jgi:hypothetical protein
VYQKVTPSEIIVLRQLQLFALHSRLRRVEAALDRLQARYTTACRVGGDFAAQRLQHEFENLAIDQAMVAHRIQRLAPPTSGANPRTTLPLRGTGRAHSAV